MSQIFQRFSRSFRHAFHGIGLILRRERSFQVQVFAAIVVLTLVIALPLDTWERVLLILLTAAVLVLEILNSIFERISDALRPRLDPVVKDVKDMMAGAVLLTSMTAAVIAVLILWDYFVNFVASRF
ncbi:MAG: diacylglycerol kinase family protein [Patescibacteria group bacterium]|jgi:diacylglycerol kinase (ATP)